MTAALAAMGTAFMWLLKLHLAHLEKDLDTSRRNAYRGASTAKEAVDELDARRS